MDNLEEGKTIRTNLPFSITYFALLKRKVIFFLCKWDNMMGKLN